MKHQLLIIKTGRTFPEIEAHVSHAQSVLELPRWSVLLGTGDHEPHQAVCFADRWGVQFHPEFNAGVTRMYVQAQREQLQAEGRDVEGILDGVRSTDVEKVLLAGFLDLVGTARGRAFTRKGEKGL